MNGNWNFCGDGVNYPKRIMDIADTHIVCSSSIFGLHIGTYFRKLKWKPSHSKIYYVKHGNRVHIKNIYKVEYYAALQLK